MLYIYTFELPYQFSYFFNSKFIACNPLFLSSLAQNYIILHPFIQITVLFKIKNVNLNREYHLIILLY